MMNKLTFFLYILFFVVIIPPLFYIIHLNTSFPSFSQSITLSDNKVIYELPYPGILPDHPLYFLKAIRDKLLDLTTRDHIQKAELYLLLSDKRANMAIQLAEKGKGKLAVSTLSKGETYALKIGDLIRTAKAQGSGPKDSLMYKLKQSNAEHREVIDTISKQLPQGEEKEVGLLIELNNKVKESLESF